MRKSTILRGVIATATVSASAIALVATSAPASAWYVDYSANAVCKDETAVINWSFKNTEPNQARLSMDVEIKDQQTGQKVTKTVAPGKSVSGTFTTNETKLDAGKVSFKMLWTDGRNGVDTRYSSYAMTDECYTPEQPAFNANVVCTVIDGSAVFTLNVNQTAGDVDGIFTPANGDTVSNGEPVEVLGVFNTSNTSEKITVKTASVEDCTPEVEEIEVCRDGETITINKDERLDTDTTVCPVEEVEEPKEEPKVLATVTELPKTGASAVVGILGSVFAGGSTLAHIVQRRKS